VGIAIASQHAHRDSHRRVVKTAGSGKATHSARLSEASNAGVHLGRSVSRHRRHRRHRRRRRHRRHRRRRRRRRLAVPMVA